MSEQNNSKRRTLKRRTLVGAIAATTVGKAVGTGAASETQQQGVQQQNADLLAGYANRAGRVSTDGLDEAFADWSDGDIDTAELDMVIDAWSSADRVVDYEIIELGNINEDTTLERAPNGEPVVYRASGSNIDVDAKLEIEPGVAIEFTEGNGMWVNSGPIVADGTEEEPILFTGTNPTRGWWAGIYVRSEAIENKLSHCVVEYGGNGTTANLDLSSSTFDSPGAVTLQNCTLRRSGAFGLTLWHDATSSSLGSHLRDAENNTYSTNRLGPAQVRVENAHTLDGSAEMVENDRSYVSVNGESMREDGTWDNLPVPYQISNVANTDGYDLDIEAGATLQFEEDAGLDVASDSVIRWQGDPPQETEGELTDPERITFTATQEERGWWDGIRISSDSTNNTLEYVTVEYGGDPDGYDANVRASSAGFDFNNCQIRHSGSYGLRISSTDDELRNTFHNSYENNADAPVRAYTGTAHQLTSSSTFVDNDEPYVFVRAQRGAGSTDLGEVTWDALDVPYRMEGNEHNIGSGDWTIDSGAVLEFEEDGRVDIGSNVGIDWRGEPPEETAEELTDPEWITFTGVQSERGWWGGIRIVTDSTNNSLEYVTVEYGGDPDGWGANIRADSGGFDFRNCRIRHSEDYGLELRPGSSIRETTNNTYANNTVPIWTFHGNTHQVSGSSTFVDNDEPYVFVRSDRGAGSTDLGEVTWDALEVPYQMEGNTHSIGETTWTIEPGTELFFEETAKINLGAADTVVNFDGTEEEPILFSGTEEIPGWWDGISFDDSESLLNTMDNCIVEYGGRELEANVDVGSELGVGGNAYVQLTNSTLRHSAASGVYVDSRGDSNADICTVNEFENNAEGDCNVE